MFASFQFSFCWIVHRRRTQQVEAENAVLRRMLEMLELAELAGDCAAREYFAVEQPCGETAAAKRCVDEEQTPGPDGEPPPPPPPQPLPAPAPAPPAETAGGEGVEAEGQQRRDAHPSARASSPAPAEAAARDFIVDGNREDGEPDVAVVMNLDHPELMEDEGRRRRRGGGLTGAIGNLMCAMSPMRWLGLLPPNDEPRVFDPDALDPASTALHTRQVLLTRLREQQARLPQSIVDQLREQQRHEQELRWNQIQRERGPRLHPQEEEETSDGSVRVSGSSSSEDWREGPNSHPAESPLGEVVIGGFDSVHGTGSIANGPRRSLENVRDAAHRRGAEGEGEGERLGFP